MEVDVRNEYYIFWLTEVFSINRKNIIYIYYAFQDSKHSYKSHIKAGLSETSNGVLINSTPQ